MRYAYNALRGVTVAVLVAFLLVRFVGEQWMPQTESSLKHGAMRAADVVSYSGDAVLDYAEEAVGVPTVNEAQEAPVSAQASKPKAKSKKEKMAEANAQYCAKHPTDHTFPCD